MSPGAILAILVSVTLVSTISLVGLLTLKWDDSKLAQRLPTLIALAAGVLFGEAIFHLIPDSIEQGLTSNATFALVLGGMGASLALELGLRRFSGREGIVPVARISLIAESVHNAIDGAILAAAYLAGFHVGLLATLAIAVHEAPHELGNFAILVNSGYERKKAVLLNLLSAGAALAGAVSMILIGKSLTNHIVYLLPVAAGCFVYMAAVDLLPGLWRRAASSTRFEIGYGLTAGVALMLLLARAN